MDEIKETFIAVYHTLKGHFVAELGNWFKHVVACRRGNPLKLYKPGKDNLRMELKTSVGAVNECNRLSPSVAMPPFVEVFRKHLDRYFADTLYKL